MYKAIFQNSKAALLFAGMTIFGAVMMVGSPEDEGVLDKAVDRFGKERETFAEDAQEFADSQSVPDKVMAPDAGWGSSKPAVFDDYASSDDADEGAPTTGLPHPAKLSNQPGALRSGPQPVLSDNVGTPVPGIDGDDALSSRSPVPVITSRQMTLTPQ